VGSASDQSGDCGGDVRQLLIEDTIISDGEAHTVGGFTPMSVAPAEIQLQPLDGGERLDRTKLRAAGRSRTRHAPESVPKLRSRAQSRF
jgi:hypothetical protein